MSIELHHLDVSSKRKELTPAAPLRIVAWSQAPDQDTLYENDVHAVHDAQHVNIDGQEKPTAMESETFDKDGIVRIQQRLHEHVEGPTSCWYHFKQGWKSIWRTKDTEDCARNRELYITTTLRELFVYICFLIVLGFITFGMMSYDMYYFNYVITALFVQSGTKPFTTIATMDDVWSYLQVTLMGALWTQSYNGMTENTDTIYYENMLLGVPRLRQLRVRNNSCNIPDAFKGVINSCFSEYSLSSQDTSSFGLANSTAWIYTGSDGTLAYVIGKISNYDSGGYIQDLFKDQAKTMAAIQLLKNNLWIDRATRIVSIDLTIYNGNINLFSVITLIAEFPATGGVIPSWNIRVVKLIRYVTTFDYCVLVLEGIFCAFILYYIIEESIEVYKLRIAYFRQFWNILDMIVIMLSLCCIGFNIYRQVVIDQKLNTLLAEKNKYVDFEFLSYADSRFNDTMAVLVFFAWIKLFKYISFNKTMNQLGTTISRCARDISGFSLMFFIFYLAYAQLGYLVFGDQNADYCTFYNSLFTLLRLILGDFNYEAMEQANVVVAPIFFITYVFFVFFILMNMFLAIVNDTYSDVKAEAATQKSDFEIVDYLRQVLKRFVDYLSDMSMLKRKNDECANVILKLRQKKKHIANVQDILQRAEKEIDLDEWRNQLQERGYGELEIDAMFERYDLDGDRVLNYDEQQRLVLELDEEKEAVERELEQTRNYDRKRYGPEATISVEEFGLFSHRVDETERTVGSLVNKIDLVIEQLQQMEQIKLRHRERMLHILEECYKLDDHDPKRRELLQDMLKRELDSFDFNLGCIDHTEAAQPN